MILDSVLEDRPIGYWPLDEVPARTTIFDRSGRQNDCTWADGTRTAKSLLNEYAGDFKGTDHVRSSGVVAAFDLVTSDVTFEVWVKYASASASVMGAFRVRNDNGDNSGDLGGIQFSNAVAGRVQFWNGNSNDITVDAGLNDGLWHHIVVTFPLSTGTKRLYVDSVERGTSSVSRPSIVSSSRRACIGGNWNPPFAPAPGSFQFMNGALAQAALYDVALKASRVRAHYLDGLGLSARLSIPLARRRRSR